MPELIDPVEVEARARGLRVRRIFDLKGRVGVLNRRCLIIEEKACQVIPSRFHIPNPHRPNVVSVPLHLPRSDWADFFIYVARPRTEGSSSYYVVPRGALSKNTAFCLESLERYRDAWDTLKLTYDLTLTARRYTVLNWQLRAVIDAATEAGLEVILIRNRKRWPPFLQTRVLIARKRCSLYSCSRISADPSHKYFNCVALRAPKGNWPEFQLFVLRQAHNEFITYVIPNGVVKKDTSVSTENTRFVFYKNNWKLLSNYPSSGASNDVSNEWRPTKLKQSPREVPESVKETMLEAENRGLLTELISSAKRDGNRLYISQKRCQVMTATPITQTANVKDRSYIPLNLPISDWAEFLIFYVKIDGTKPMFYVLPRIKLTKRTLLSQRSSWLGEFEQAWHLFRPET